MKKIQEASEDISRRRNSIASPKISYMEENTQRTKKQAITHKKTHSCTLSVTPRFPKTAI